MEKRDESGARAQDGPTTTHAEGDEGALGSMSPTLVHAIELWPLGKLVAYDRNPRTHTEEQIDKLAASILEFGFVNPILVSGGVIRAGHGRAAAARKLGLAEVPVVLLDHLSEGQARAFTIADNRLAELAGWDEELLAAELAELVEGGESLATMGFSDTELAALASDLEGGGSGAGAPFTAVPTPEEAKGTLAKRFGVPPFSVLDAKQGYWQERKAAWVALGIRSEVGRDGNLLGMSDTALAAGAGAPVRSLQEFDTGGYEGGDAYVGGTSIFDPVLTELAYRWWCPEGGRILDPFAGGSVRGIVAARLGFTYCGLELRAEQVQANREQAERILGAGWELKVQWIEADAAELTETLRDSDPFDFLFTCPPYFDLERYSDDPRDLSAAPSYEAFLESLRNVLRQAVALLAPDRWACIVVSDVRDGQGIYRGLERDTQLAMEDAGAGLYNLAVLAQLSGSLPIRAGRIFSAGRKLPRNHQAVQVFSKGKPQDKLRELLGPTGWEEIGEAAEALAAAALPLAPLVVGADPAEEFGELLEGGPDGGAAAAGADS